MIREKIGKGTLKNSGSLGPSKEEARRNRKEYFYKWDSIPRKRRETLRYQYIYYLNSERAEGKRKLKGEREPLPNGPIKMRDDEDRSFLHLYSRSKKRGDPRGLTLR